MTKAIQDFYPDDVAHCYGCGRLNDHGLHVRSVWEGDELVAHFTPREYHTAIPGFVYGGLIASLIDCHSTGTASAAAHKHAGFAVDEGSPPRFVTGMLKVDYLRPTPIDGELVIRARAVEIKPRKVVVHSTLYAHGEPCAKGEVIAVLMPEGMTKSER
ncbi:MAG TPA: PaaI family thioesterase [Thermoflexales bacterium]|nr:PaaI family thioesterase [Thermoflexales bacterium]